MNHIQQVNLDRQKLIKKRDAVDLPQQEKDQLARCISELQDYVIARGGRDKAIHDLYKTQNATTAICTHCGSQYGHPGPCHECVPRNGEIIQVAVDLACKAHRLEFRKGPGRIAYICHPADVVKQLARWGFTNEHPYVFETGWLHDAIESGMTFEEIERNCGRNVAWYVQQLSIPAIEGKTPREAKQEYMRSFFGKNPLLIVVKIADRCRNIQDFLDHDPGYAMKYFHQAKPLFEAFYSEENVRDFVEVYGREIFDRVSETIEHYRKVTGN